MAHTIYILTGSFEGFSDAWVKYNSPIDQINCQVGESGSVYTSSMMVSPNLTEEEFLAGASTASVPYRIVNWDLYSCEASYSVNIEEPGLITSTEISHMPNVSTASNEEIINYIQLNNEPFASLSLVEIENAS